MSSSYTAQLESAAPKVTLENWMCRYQAGEAQAVDVLYAEISPRLRTIFRNASNPTDEEEMLQETWFQIHRSRHTWRPGEMLLPWIYSIARHVRAAYFRKKSRRGEVELNERISTPAPELSFDWEQLLEELPASQREAILMMKVEGHTLEEVAAATNSSVGSVKQKVHRGYEKLRSLLGGRV